MARLPIRYRLELDNSRGRCACEQAGFLTPSGDGETIVALDLVCSGVRPVG